MVLQLDEYKPSTKRRIPRQVSQDECSCQADVLCHWSLLGLLEIQTKHVIGQDYHSHTLLNARDGTTGKAAVYGLRDTTVVYLSITNIARTMAQGRVIKK